ncbi:hypothetical protein J3R82DRAFT_396 [Butyriboletus roseoflavus]|nr:hypothetical protein J3R82DRAFT_396 [Butyriboletus roseoflavus]
MPVELTHRTSLTFGSTSISAQPKSVTSNLYNDFTLSIPRPPCPSPSQDTAIVREGSPSSTMTLRRADASPHVPILVDADLFSTVQPPQTLHRRSSCLSRWIMELQTSTHSDVPDLSDVDPLSVAAWKTLIAYMTMSLSMKTLRLECPPEDPVYDQLSHGSAPTDIASPRSTIRLINPPQSLRHFHLLRRSVSPSPRTTSSRSPSRLSVFHQPSRGNLTSGTSAPSYHSRSTSLQTSLPHNAPQISTAPHTDARISPADTLTDRSRSRPSISSSTTCSSVTTPTTMSMHEDGESPVPSILPSKPSSLFSSLRVRSQAGGVVSQPCFKSDRISASSPSLRPLYPASAPHLPERQMVLPSSPKGGGTIRLPFASKSRCSRSGLDTILMEEPE